MGVDKHIETLNIKARLKAIKPTTKAEAIESLRNKILDEINYVEEVIVYDDDDKLVVAPKGVDYSDDAIDALTEFQEQYFESEIIR